MKRRNIAIARTRRLTFRPVVLSDNKPKSSPMATTGITNQFSHPSNGMSATSAAMSAAIPMSVEIRFMGLLNVRLICALRSQSFQLPPVTLTALPLM